MRAGTSLVEHIFKIRVKNKHYYERLNGLKGETIWQTKLMKLKLLKMN